MNTDALQLAAQGCLQSLVRISKGIGHYATVIDRDLDITDTQFWALWELWLTGPLALKDLASKLRLDSSTVVGVVDRMAVKGLVLRSPDSVDRRRISLTVTRKGEELLATARQAFEGPLLGGFSALGAERLQELQEILRFLEGRLLPADPVPEQEPSTLATPLERKVDHA